MKKCDNILEIYIKLNVMGEFIIIVTMWLVVKTAEKLAKIDNQ